MSSPFDLDYNNISLAPSPKRPPPPRAERGKALLGGIVLLAVVLALLSTFGGLGTQQSRTATTPAQASAPRVPAQTSVAAPPVQQPQAQATHPTPPTPPSGVLGQLQAEAASGSQGGCVLEGTLVTVSGGPHTYTVSWESYSATGATGALLTLEPGTVYALLTLEPGNVLVLATSDGGALSACSP